jgi:Tol biopolymer transport system component
VTKDGSEKVAMVTDGSRIYFTTGGVVNSLYQVSSAGGDAIPVQTPFPDPTVFDVSPDRSKLLVGSCPINPEDCQIYTLSVLGLSPQHIGNIRSPVAWSPDGKDFVYVQGTSLYQARSDGTELRKITTLAAGETSYYYPAYYPGGWPRWSPDGSRLRFQRQHSKQRHVALGGLLRRPKSPPFASGMEQPAVGVLRQLDAGREVFPFPVNARRNDEHLGDSGGGQRAQEGQTRTGAVDHWAYVYLHAEAEYRR